MKVDDAFHGISTLITTKTGADQVQGSGFFFQRLSPKLDDGPQWRGIDELWLVTNRHVVLPAKNRGKGRKIPDSLTFSLRKAAGEGVKWEPITLKRDELLRRAIFHEDPSVDIAAISILDLVIERIRTEAEQYLQFYPVHGGMFAGQNNVSVAVGDEALVVGYPRGFYDKVNLFPIVKAGVIASRWGANFDGKPFFLIDAKLFPGSSGSIVVTRPIDIAIVDGKVMHASEKQFAFLGIFSGEPFQEEQQVDLEDLTIIRKVGFNVGVVWYAHLVEDALGKGVKISSQRELDRIESNGGRRSKASEAKSR